MTLISRFCQQKQLLINKYPKNIYEFQDLIQSKQILLPLWFFKELSSRANIALNILYSHFIMNFGSRKQSIE